jgi:plastocyanin
MTARFLQVLRLAAVPLVLVLGSLGAPTVSAGNPCFHGFTMPPATSEATTEIKLLPCAFAPTVAHVAVGSQVTFFNGPEFAHLITGANQAWGSPDVELAPGEQIAYTFDTAGIYPFACVLHPGMSGTIVVGDATAATGGSTGAGSGAAATEATTSAPASQGPDGGVLAALGIIAGLVAGASVTWLRLRWPGSRAGGATGPAARPTSAARGSGQG